MMTAPGGEKVSRVNHLLISVGHFLSKKVRPLLITLGAHLEEGERRTDHLRGGIKGRASRNITDLVQALHFIDGETKAQSGCVSSLFGNRVDSVHSQSLSCLQPWG